jgi:hypothetical protein
MTKKEEIPKVDVFDMMEELATEEAKVEDLLDVSMPIDDTDRKI